MVARPRQARTPREQTRHATATAKPQHFRLPPSSSVATSQTDPFHVWRRTPRDTTLFLTCEQDSARHEVKSLELRSDGRNMVIDCGAPVTAAPKTFTAHCPLKRGRQLALHSATGHWPTYHGQRAVPLQVQKVDIVHSLSPITDAGRPLMWVSELGDRVKILVFNKQVHEV